MRPLKSLEKDLEYFRSKYDASENNPSDQLYYHMRIAQATRQIQLWKEFLSSADE